MCVRPHCFQHNRAHSTLYVATEHPNAFADGVYRHWLAHQQTTDVGSVAHGGDVALVLSDGQRVAVSTSRTSVTVALGRMLQVGLDL